MGARRRAEVRRQRWWNLLALATLLALGVVWAPESPGPSGRAAAAATQRAPLAARHAWVQARPAVRR